MWNFTSIPNKSRGTFIIIIIILCEFLHPYPTKLEGQVLFLKIKEGFYFLAFFLIWMEMDIIESKRN